MKFFHLLRHLVRRYVMRFFLSPSNQADSLFQLTFKIFIQFAAADGKIVAGEILAIERFARNELALSKQTQKAVLGIMRETNCSKGEFEKSVRLLYDTVNGNRIILETIFDVLLAIAKADYKFSIEERQFWIKAGEICNFSEQDLKRLMARHIEQPRLKPKKTFKNSTRNNKNKSQQKQNTTSYYQPVCYEILGADQNEDFSSIKSKYRKLVKEAHPDTVASLGAPEEFRKTIEARFIEIQAAYEEVCRLRGES